jgi:DNA polymerase type B, organellar and viral
MTVDMGFSETTDVLRSASNAERKQRSRANNPEHSHAYDREDKRKRRRDKSENRPFVGVDGEGGNTGLCRGCIATWGKPLCQAFTLSPVKKDAKKLQCECGHSVDVHNHEYWLFRVGERSLETGKPLTTYDLLSFIADLDLSRGQLLVGYFLDYDDCQILRDLPPYKLERLNNREARTPRKPGVFQVFPVDVAVGPCIACQCPAFQHRTTDPDSCTTCGDPAAAHKGHFDVDYMPKHHLKIRRSTPKGEKNNPWVEISDVGSFFQDTFVGAITDWDIGTPRQREQIVRGKEARANFQKPDDTMRAYNALEIRLLEDLMTKFRRTMIEVGIPMPYRWQGPGQLAGALLKQHDIPKAATLSYWKSDSFKTAMNACYYGGRFETSAVGYISDFIYNPDINSAYPYAMIELPCLVHGEWSPGRKPSSDLYIAHGTFTATEPVKFYGLPFRSEKGMITFPAAGRGWYWSFEIQASRHQSFAIDDCWSYHKRCDCRPMSWVSDLYQRRIDLGPTTKGNALKLVLNSLYGKLCQRVGSAPYNNLVWSSFITAYVRTMIQDFIHSLPDCIEGGRQCGTGVYMIATDSVFTSDLPAGYISDPLKPLGGWACKRKDEHREGIFIAQSGIYYGSALDDDGNLARPKSRGISRDKARDYEHLFKQQFRKYIETGDLELSTVTIETRGVITLALAMHQRKPHLVGQWVTGEIEQSFNHQPKRAPETYPSSEKLATLREFGLTDEIEHLRTYPLAGDPSVETEHYSKKLANFLESSPMKDWIDPTSNQPDWGADYGFGIGDEL